MSNYDELKRLAEAFPDDLDWGGNDVPYSLHPEFGVVGGEADGTYTVYGKPFRIEGEGYDYDGPTYVERCGIDFAKFMVAARDGVLALVAENERLKDQVRLAGISAEATVHDAIGRVANDYLLANLERDQLKAENIALRESAQFRAIQSLRADVAELRKDAERLDWLSAQSEIEAPGQGDVRGFIDAAMDRGEQQ